MPFSRAIANIDGSLTTVYTSAVAEANVFSAFINCEVDSNVYLYRLNGTTLTTLAFLRLTAGTPYQFPHKIILTTGEAIRARAMDRLNTVYPAPEESTPLAANVQIDLSILT